MIGDKFLDIETGKNANIRSALVKTGYGRRVSETDHRADIVGRDLFDAVEMILQDPLR